MTAERVDPRTSVAHPWSTRLLMIALVFQGLSGIVGGLALFGDPTGATLGVRLEWLDGSPFSDYRIPGLILGTVLGVAPIVVAWGAWTRKPWSWPGSLLVGAALVVWIVVEILIIGYHAEPPLQAVYGVLGLCMLALAALPRVRDDLHARA